HARGGVGVGSGHGFATCDVLELVPGDVLLQVGEVRGDEATPGVGSAAGGVGNDDIHYPGPRSLESGLRRGASGEAGRGDAECATDEEVPSGDRMHHCISWFVSAKYAAPTRRAPAGGRE